MPQRTNSLVGYGLTNNNNNNNNNATNPEESLKSALPKLTSSYSTSEIPTRFNKGSSMSAFDELESDHQNLMIKSSSDINANDICLQFQAGYCPRGDLCPYVHTHVLPNTSRTSSAGMPLSPGLSMSVGTMANGSASFYARVNGSVGGGTSSSSLANAAGFPFSVSSSGFNNTTSTGSNSLLRLQQQQQQPQQQQQQQQQQSNNSIALANKANQKRAPADVEANRFAGAALESFVGQIYSLCKDQHGCRYLQKKLEEQNEKYLAIIFGEVFGHFVELMTGKRERPISVL